MKIRRATTEDVALLAELNRYVHELHVAAEPELYRPYDSNAIAAVFATWIDGEDREFLVAERDGETVGYASVQVLRRPAHTFAHARASVLVDQLAVVPAARRSGVGRQLMAAAEEYARSHGIARVELDVRGFNQQAIDFYRSCSYEVDKIRFARRVD